MESKLEEVSPEIKQKIAENIYSYCYEIGLTFEIDSETGSIIKVDIEE